MGAAVLRSPWDGHPVKLTDALFDCPKLPVIARDLTTDGFYSLDDPTHSIVDPVRLEAYKRSSGGVKAAGAELVRAADAFRSSGSRSAGKCVVDSLLGLAGQGSLTGKMSSSQAYYVQGWIAGTFAISYLKVRDAGLASPEQRQIIAGWLESIGDATRRWYDAAGAKRGNSARNNHFYWAGLELVAIGVAADDRKDFEWGLGTYEAGVIQIGTDGTLPLEMARGARALHYHLYALAPLVLLAEFGEANGLDLYAAHGGAIHRLVKVSIEGTAHPEFFVAATGKSQEGSRTLSGDQIGWAPPYVRRFPNPEIENYIKNARSLSSLYLGGLPPP